MRPQQLWNIRGLRSTPGPTLTAYNAYMKPSGSDISALLSTLDEEIAKPGIGVLDACLKRFVVNMPEENHDAGRLLMSLPGLSGGTQAGAQDSITAKPEDVNDFNLRRGYSYREAKGRSRP